MKKETGSKHHKYHYYKLNSEASTWQEIVAAPFKAVINTILGLPSYLLGRILALLIFNPLFNNQPEQDDFQYKQSKNNPDALHMEDFAVLNVTDKPSFLIGITRNYARKLLSSFPYFPDFMVDLIERQIFRVKRIDEQKCQELLGRLCQQMNGIALDGSPLIPLDPDKIFLKGTEFIDPKLRKRFVKNINSLIDRNNDYEGNFDIKDNAKKINFFSLELRNGAVLDSVEIAAMGESDKPYHERTFVIACMPRSNSYTAWLKRHRAYANAINTTFVSFNYRGVERSRGLIWDQNDMVCDAMAQAERLLKLGVRPENIAFQGECLGAAIATMAAAKMHRDGYEVKLFNARSFQSTSKLVMYKILPGKHASRYNPITGFRYLAAGFFFLTGMPLLKITGWDMPAAKAYDSIPEKDKGYLNVARDPIIESSHASIYAHCKERYKKLSNAVENGTASPEEKAELQAMGDNKRHKFYLTDDGQDDKKVNRHTCPLQMLHPKEKGRPQPSFSSSGTRESLPNNRDAVDKPQSVENGASRCERSSALDAREYQIQFFRRAFLSGNDGHPRAENAPCK